MFYLNIYSLSCNQCNNFKMVHLKSEYDASATRETHFSDVNGLNGASLTSYVWLSVIDSSLLKSNQAER